MTEIRFYHLQNQSLEQALPALLSKAYQGGHKILVKGRDQNTIEKLNESLWTDNPNSFLPHGSEKDGNAALQPIWLTTTEDNANNANVLILLDGQNSKTLNEYDLVCEIFDGRNDNAVKNARSRWKKHKESDAELTYWQQNENGGWDKKA